MRSISYLFLILTTSLCATQFPAIQLTDIKNIPNEIVRPPRMRHVVWFDKESEQYYKVWPLDFKSNRSFEYAVKCGFYDEFNTPLTALIYYGEQCCGYVTRKLQYTSTECPGLVLEPFKYRRHTLERIAPAAQQNLAYQLLFDDLIERVKKYGLVFMDLNKKNIAWDQGKFFLIDLEYLLAIKDVSTLFFDNIHLPRDYRTIVRELQANLPK